MSEAVRTLETPVGIVTVVATGAGVRRVSFGAVREAARGEAEAEAVVERGVRELRAYFEGSLRAFMVPIDLVGTEFQVAVWKRLCGIPYGETASYGRVARDIAPEVGGGVGASRAVGLANHENPVALIVPCHRVIGADGTLTGYAGGLEVKRWLLDHEASVSGKNLWAAVNA